ncbi:MAG: hypothetical protein EPGJADBJ_05116 [Saprospiraceae bacterium]|nr:hypothetical protein [Saprospiraceae bacterium]
MKHTTHFPQLQPTALCKLQTALRTLRTAYCKLLLQLLLLLLLQLLLLLLPTAAPAQDPDLADDERARMEDIFRTSDHESETPTNRRQREGRTKRVSVPKGAFRIGCLCMDDTWSDTKSTGACSGHGGVRFWVYRTPAGDTVHVMTDRHERHPHPLSAAEMSELSQKRADRIQKLPTVANPLAPVPYAAPTTTPPVVILPDGAGDRFTWSDALALAVTGVALYFIVRMVLRWAGANDKLIRYALRHLLRPGKRPPARPVRKTARKKRLP